MPHSPMFPVKSSPFDWSVTAGIGAARWADAALDVWQGTRLGATELAARTAGRLRAMLQHAQRSSAFYRDLHAGVPLDGSAPLSAFPTIDRRTLMREFDRVSTRPDVTLRTIERFLQDHERAGTLLHGRYAVWTSSGTTGQQGVFVHDAEALAVYDALEAQRFRGTAASGELLRSWWAPERYAMVAATGGHFAGVASLERLRRAVPWLAPWMRTCSLLQPLDDLVGELNAFGPNVLATYPTAAEMLAEEQVAGRLKVSLRELWTGGECLAASTRTRLQTVFGCRVRSSYGASEFLPIAWECPHRQLHVNSDWVILEPIDADGRPVPPGQPSHSVLLTNLANRVQPLIRYDLGDSITADAQPCACGSIFPVIAVEGRCDDALVMPLARGGTAAVVPLALATVLEEQAHVHDYQLVQTAPSAVTVRLGAEEGDAAAAVRRALRAYFRAMGFATVSLDVAAGAPRRDLVSGKLRRVIRRVPHQPA